MSSRRQYLDTHPWITFRLDPGRLSHRTWLLFGEAESTCQHIAGVPLRPATARRLYEVYLSKGVHGTTSIEGNTLSEDEVLRRVTGDLQLPPSLEYLGREVDNILDAYRLITDEIVQRRPHALTPARIGHFNELVLRDLDRDEDVVPGKVRQHSVTVMRYRGAPAEDCDYLLDRMCTWINDLAIDGDASMTFPIAILKAILAHLYIAWIHPYGDGNGRTARLVEFQLLVRAGLPPPAAHLMSNFYNRTRDAYYRELARTSREPYPVEQFVHYAMQGFADELRSQLDVIQAEQQQVTWENFVHESFRDQDTPAKRRQKHIVLDLTDIDRPVPVNRLKEISGRVALGYAGRGDKTVTRDVNELLNLQLIRRVRGGLVANVDIIRAFLPVRAPGD